MAAGHLVGGTVGAESAIGRAWRGRGSVGKMMAEGQGSLKSYIGNVVNWLLSWLVVRIVRREHL